MFITSRTDLGIVDMVIQLCVLEQLLLEGEGSGFLRGSGFLPHWYNVESGSLIVGTSFFEFETFCGVRHYHHNFFLK